MEPKTTHLVCIVCPNGCRLTVTGTPDDWQVSGNLCPKGAMFAKNEMTHPMRSLTTTVQIHGAVLPVLPVRTAKDIPRELIPAAMRQLNSVTVQAPVICGQTVVRDLAGTGVDVIATATLPEGGQLL